MTEGSKLTYDKEEQIIFEVKGGPDETIQGKPEKEGEPSGPGRQCLI